MNEGGASLIGPPLPIPMRFTMAKAANDEGLPEGFEYMDPPPGWPPARSAEELRSAIGLRHLHLVVSKDEERPRFGGAFRLD